MVLYQWFCINPSWRFQRAVRTASAKDDFTRKTHVHITPWPEVNLATM